MKKIFLVLIASILLVPVLSSAQTSPQPPAAWVDFMQQEKAKRVAFNQQLKADRETFMSSHPEVKAYLDQIRAASKERMAAWRAAHPRRNSLTP